MILAIIQARMSSTRLPGKTMKPLLGTPMLFRQVERVQRAKLIDKLIVATSDDTSDNAIARACKARNVAYTRGSLGDVLDRVSTSAAKFSPEHVVRLTADCPLIDPKVIDDVVELHLSGNYDYTCNRIPPTFPDGLDVEVCSAAALESAWREAESSYEREHVTPYLYESGNFSVGKLVNSTDLSEWRWTVDVPEDFELVERVYTALYASNPTFDMADVEELINQNPDLALINRRHAISPGQS